MKIGKFEAPTQIGSVADLVGLAAGQIECLDYNSRMSRVINRRFGILLEDIRQFDFAKTSHLDGESGEFARQ